MQKIIFLLSATLLGCYAGFGQTGVGLGIYPTGTETGIGFRSNKENRMMLEARLTRASFFSEPGISSCITEVSGIYRLVKLEKVRFHIGIGFRGDWNLSTSHKIGAVVPIGVEAFPFPFQNAGLFFEAAPFYVTNTEMKYNAGIRTVAGFVFYFERKVK